MRQPRWSLVIPLVLLATVSRRAAASPTDLFGALPAGTATAGAQTAAGTDIGAVYYNPANLGIGGSSGHASLQLGYAYGLPLLKVNRSGDTATSISTYPTSNPSGQGYYTLGAMIPIGGKIRNLLTFGILFYLPQSKIIEVDSVDPEQTQWLRYQSDANRIVFAAGFGARPVPWLALGIGIQVLAGLGGTVNLNADLFAQSVTSRNLSFSLDYAVAPTAGISIEPTKDLRFSVAYRGPLQVNVTLPAQIELSGLGNLDFTVNGVLDYTPHQVSAAAQIPIVEGLKISLDLLWQHWATSPNPAIQLDVSTGGAVLDGLGLSSILGLKTNDPPPGFTDTLTPSASIVYVPPGHMWVLRAGYAYRPTYVPNQVASTNYLDADAHIIATGVTFRFYDALEIFTNPLNIDVGGQVQILPTRSVDKAQAADPVGNYSFGGEVVALAASVRYDF